MHHRTRLGLTVALALGVGCTSGGDDDAEAEPRCDELLSFRDQSQLDTIAPLPDGYVLNDVNRLMGYDADDTPRFAVEGSFEGFGTTADGRLITVRRDERSVVAEAWSASGTALGEVARLEDPALALNPKGVEILADGNFIAYGGTFTDWWYGSTGGPNPGVVERSDVTEVDGVIALDDGSYYRISTTIGDEMGTTWQDDLAYVTSDGQTAWTSIIATKSGDEFPPSPELRAVVHEDLYLTLTGPDFDPRTIETRRYDKTGAVVSSESDEFTRLQEPGLPLGMPSGEVLWADRVDDDIRLRFFDDTGAVTCEQQVQGDPIFPGISDIALVGDTLLVLNMDRITNLRLLHAAP